MPMFGKGKHSEDDNQSGLPKFVKKNRAQAEREQARNDKVRRAGKKPGKKGETD